MLKSLIDINDTIIFESRLSELLSKEAVLKEAAKEVQEYVKSVMYE